MTASNYAKYKFRHGENTPQGRLAAAYEDGEYGKSPLINRTMEAGAILLDCNLQEIVIGLSKLDAYVNGDSSQRRALLLAELRVLGGGIIEPITQMREAAPVAPPQAAVEPASPVHVAAAAEPAAEPVAVQEPARARQLPNLGASLDDEDEG